MLLFFCSVNYLINDRYVHFIYHLPNSCDFFNFFFFFNTENTVSVHYCFQVEADIGWEEGLSFWAWQGTGCCVVVSDRW